MNYKKVYVEMIANIKPDGSVKPLTMIWDNNGDQEKYEIDRVLSIQKACARKAGGVGLRYLVLIQGREKILWYENPAWFVEVPESMHTERDV